MKKILITYRLFPEGLVDLDERSDKYEYIAPKDKSVFRKEEVLEMIPEFDVLIPNFGFYTDKEMMDKATKLELIANYGVGYNNIDVEYATKKNIAVTNIPNSVLEPTAEFAFGLLIAAGRRIGFYNQKIRTPEGVSWGMNNQAGVPVFGKTLGIIGMGRIGQAVARRAVASGMRIIYHNRHKLDPVIEKQYNATYVDFDKLLSEADYISLNAPSTPETYHLISAPQFALMKPTAVFINTARGNMVNERDLADALEKEKIFAAGLDVFEDEPHILPKLLELDNVVLTPHAGTKTKEGRIDMIKETVRNIIGFYEGTFSVSKVN